MYITAPHVSNHLLQIASSYEAHTIASLTR